MTKTRPINIAAGHAMKEEELKARLRALKKELDPQRGIDADSGYILRGFGSQKESLLATMENFAQMPGRANTATGIQFPLSHHTFRLFILRWHEHHFCVPPISRPEQSHPFCQNSEVSGVT